MVKRNILRILIIAIIVLMVLNVNIFAAKTYHFKAFLAEAALDEAGDWEEVAIEQAVQAMQKLEYVNYYGTNNYDIANTKQEILNYINMTGKNYGLVIFAHGSSSDLRINNNERLYASDIRGTWHLVLINSCYTYQNDSFARAFKTVGETHRASIGFNDELFYDESFYFWRTFNELICSTNLNAIVATAKNISGAPAVLYGDGSWNGYAWY